MKKEYIFIIIILILALVVYFLTGNKEQKNNNLVVKSTEETQKVTKEKEEPIKIDTKTEVKVTDASKCLPENISLTYKDIEGTVESKLKSVGAVCRDGILVDSKNQKIQIYTRLNSLCTPAQNMNRESLLAQETNQINQLKKTYNVIFMDCPVYDNQFTPQ